MSSCQSAALIVCVLHLGIGSAAGRLAAGEPTLADLIDVEAIRNLTLTELEWQEESREEVGDVLVLRGSWKGPTYRGYSSSQQEVELSLTERATVWIPLAQPANTEISQIVWGVHTDGGPLDVPWDACLELPSRLPVAILRHGEKRQDWIDLGFTSRDHWLFRSLDFVIDHNRCAPVDYRFSSYIVSLTETEIMAITLLSRLLAREGYQPGRAAVGGLSKEGWSTWLSSAIDDRIVAAAPGGFQRQDLVDSIATAISNIGCAAEVEALRWFETTEGGAVFLNYFSVAEFATELKTEFLVLFGDVGLDGMHDGEYFTPGDETHFLESFSAVPFRYDRLPDDSGRVTQSPGEARETFNELRSRLVTLLTHYLLTGDAASYPKVTTSSVEIGETSFRAVARVDPGPEAVRLWWSFSNDRAFNDFGNAPWEAIDMALDEGAWVSPWVDFPAGMMVGWYVEAEGALEWDGLTVAQRDTSPQRFFHDFLPLTCARAPVDCSPPAAPTGLSAIGRNNRVLLDWDDNTETDLDGYMVERAEIPDGEYAVVAPLVLQSEYTDTDVVNGKTYSYIVTALDRSTNESEPSAATEATPIPDPFLRGDCNDDGTVDLSDAVSTLGFLFLGDGDPNCDDACDSNDDGLVDTSDPITTLAALFLGDVVIAAPGIEACGVDPTEDRLECETATRCAE